jgi:MFS transporter, PAT family, beta-lactamase induction signal transducer AmpG
MAFIDDPLNNMGMLRLLGFFVGFFGALQDIAVDGLAIDILPTDQQARANGLMWGSKTVGISASVALGVFMINKFGFFYAITSFSALVFLIMFIPLLIKERPCEKKLPWSKKGGVSRNAAKIQLQSWKDVFLSLFRVFFLPVSFTMGVAAFSFSIGRGLMDTLCLYLQCNTWVGLIHLIHRSFPWLTWVQEFLGCLWQVCSLTGMAKSVCCVFT